MIHRAMIALLFGFLFAIPVLAQETGEDKDKEKEGRRPRRSITLFLTPDPKLLPAISAEIQKAKKTIDVAMYSLSIETIRVAKPAEPKLEGKSDAEKESVRKAYAEDLDKYEAYRERVEEGRISIYDALAEAIARGVKVRLIFNQGHKGEWKVFQSEQLQAIGVELRYTTRTMHEKFGIIDGKVLLTGSANWSQSAANIYDESAFVFRGYPELLGKFQEEFDLIWARSAAYPPKEKPADDGAGGDGDGE